MLGVIGSLLYGFVASLFKSVAGFIKNIRTQRKIRKLQAGKAKWRKQYYEAKQKERKQEALEEIVELENKIKEIKNQDEFENETKDIII